MIVLRKAPVHLPACQESASLSPGHAQHTVLTYVHIHIYIYIYKLIYTYKSLYI